MISKIYQDPVRAVAGLRPLFFLGLMMITFLYCSGTAHAGKTLYVAPGGSDAGNSCISASSPCKTINHAVSQMSDGDTLKVGSGTYTDTVSGSCAIFNTRNVNIYIESKNCPNGCTIEAENGPGSATISNDGSGVSICIKSANGWTIKNLDFNNTKNVLSNGSSDGTTIQDDTFSYTDSSAAIPVYIDSSDSVTLTGTSIVNTVGCNINIDGSYLFKSAKSSNVTIEQSTLAYDNHIADFDSTNGVIFRRNRVKMFTEHGLQIEQGSSNVLIENNLFEGDPACSGVTQMVGPRVIDVYEVDGLTVRNNTVVGHGDDWQHWWYFTYGQPDQAAAGCTDGICDRARIRSYNNLVYDVMPAAKRWVDMSFTDLTTQTDLAMDGNLYYGGAETWTEWLGCGGDLPWSQWKGCSGWDGTNNMDPHSYNVAPSFADYAGGDYRAANADSPQVDAGQGGLDSLGVSRCATEDFNGSLRTDGKCDIGAFEFGAEVGGGPDTTPPLIPTGISVK